MCVGTLLLGWALAGASLAALPEPDAVYYGEAALRGQAVGAGAVVSLRVDDETLATYRVGDLPNAGTFYVLRVRMVHLATGEPRPEGRGVTGLGAIIHVDDVPGPSVTLGARGTVTLLNVTAPSDSSTTTTISFPTTTVTMPPSSTTTTPAGTSTTSTVLSSTTVTTTPGTTTTTTLAHCGNGVAEADEECGEPGLPICAAGALCEECRCAPIAEVRADPVCGAAGGRTQVVLTLTTNGADLSSMGFLLRFPPEVLGPDEARITCGSAAVAAGFRCLGQADCEQGTLLGLVLPPEEGPTPALADGTLMTVGVDVPADALRADTPLCETEPPGCDPLTFDSTACGDAAGDAVPCVFVDTCAAVPGCIPGDCTGDGGAQLANDDVECSIRRFFDPEAAGTSACEDCNGDGRLTSADVTCTIRCLFGPCF